MQSSKTYKKVHISIDVENLKNLKPIQEKNKESLAEIINNLLEEYIKEQESK